MVVGEICVYFVVGREGGATESTETNAKGQCTEMTGLVSGVCMVFSTHNAHFATAKWTLWWIDHTIPETEPVFFLVHCPFASVSAFVGPYNKKQGPEALIGKGFYSAVSQLLIAVHQLVNES